MKANLSTYQQTSWGVNALDVCCKFLALDTGIPSLIALL